MKRRFQIFACITLAISVWACERPQAPDFKVDHTLQVPLTVAKTYQFLGNSNALIDTTGENFDSLFTVGSNGLISIAKEESFDFGDLNDAIPQVNVDPVTVISEVGEISLTNFSSNGSLGSAGFKEITGESTSLQKGDNLPGGSTPGPIKIDLDTDYFVSATIKNDGSLAFTVTNNLGFDISNLTITLNSGSSFVGSTSLNSFQSGETSTCSIPIPANSFLSNLNVDIT
ncbi:MAG TPA: hypothetical protein VFG39_00050, partial [Balneolaceae bacterium]|nr:hypothetical protein [Balneolaceae bacterium]